MPKDHQLDTRLFLLADFERARHDPPGALLVRLPRGLQRRGRHVRDGLFGAAGTQN
jgi:hypothetical protein